MKRSRFFSALLLIIFSCMAISLSGCRTGTYSSSYGKEDMAYISIISGKQYAGKTVSVSVDGKDSFNAKVVKEKQSTEKHNGQLYGIRPGKRTIVITYQNKTLYSNTVFLSSQQTKLIRL